MKELKDELKSIDGSIWWMGILIIIVLNFNMCAQPSMTETNQKLTNIEEQLKIISEKL